MKNDYYFGKEEAMKTVELLKDRRSYYDINKEIPVSEEKVRELVENTTELVPDAFNMKSSRAVVATGEKHEKLWDNVHKAFEGMVPKEKTDSFKKGYGTVLFFYDMDVVNEHKDEFELYASNFEDWATQSSGMLQLSVWIGLRELGIGASLQHYNPVIDKMVREMFDVPESWVLKAQMPFGGIGEEPAQKEKENIWNRVKVWK